MIEKVREKMIDMKYRMLVKSLLLREGAKDRRERLKEFWGDEKGIAVIEVILILVVVMALGVVFRKNIKQLFDNIFKEINASGKKIIKKY